MSSVDVWTMGIPTWLHFLSALVLRGDPMVKSCCRLLLLPSTTKRYPRARRQESPIPLLLLRLSRNTVIWNFCPQFLHLKYWHDWQIFPLIFPFQRNQRHFISLFWGLACVLVLIVYSVAKKTQWVLCKHQKNELEATSSSLLLSKQLLVYCCPSSFSFSF